MPPRWPVPAPTKPGRWAPRPWRLWGFPTIGWCRCWLGVGNYGEIFERNLGEQTPMQLSRGVNALWTQGGILYAPPMP